MTTRSKAKRKGNDNAREIAGVAVIALAVLIGVAVYGNAAGKFLALIGKFTFGVFGIMNYLLPVAVAAAGVMMIANVKGIGALKTVMIVLGGLSIFCVIHLIAMGRFSFSPLTYGDYIAHAYSVGWSVKTGGGALAALPLYPMLELLGTVGSYIFFVALLIISVLVVTGLSVRDMSKKLSSATAVAVKKTKDSVWQQIETHEDRKKRLFIDDLGETEEQTRNPYAVDLAEDIDMRPTRRVTPKPLVAEAEEKPVYTPSYRQKPVKVADDVTDAEEALPEEIPAAQDYAKPSIDILNKNTKHRRALSEQTMKKNAERLEETLASFGVSAEVVNVSRGPVVTRYELVPAVGVRISRIAELSNDIALNMEASRVRIEAPIPGKAAVGIEIPNSEADSVSLYELLSSPEYAKAAVKSPLAFALGQDLAGKNVYADIAKMPHMLIAGATGSGKSVCINAIIVSLLMNATPEQVRLIMIDPKMVELSAYNGIPHLKWPVVTDCKKAAGTLNWAVAEMTQRYKSFAEKGAKDLERYNALAAEGEDKLPCIVIIIDELADLMLVSKHEVEDAICRIAQLGRACGIHLIVATQRPSVNVITGIIKANVPTRIAFSVSSQVDSRTILDVAGAEKLLGRGDMLYHPVGQAKPTRLQGAFVQDAEVERVVEFLKQNNVQTAVEEEESPPGEEAVPGEEEETDALLPQAIEVGLEFGQISTSMLQRRLRIGYARAGRLIDEMEVRGLVSGFEGAKPRKMLITKEEFEALKDK